jgi:hypothetical protein
LAAQSLSRLAKPGHVNFLHSASACGVELLVMVYCIGGEGPDK